MKSLKKILEINGVGKLYTTLRTNGIDEIGLLCRLKFDDLEKYGIKKDMEKLIIMKIIYEYNEFDKFKYDRVSKPVDSGSEIDSMSIQDNSSLLSPIKSKNSLFSSHVYAFPKTGLEDQKIIVCVRKRPSFDKNDDSVKIIRNKIIVSEPKVRLDLAPYIENHQFIFDVAFDGGANNDDVYGKCVREIVRHVSEGGCGSIIAYGQTGTGKTHTMMRKDTGMIYYCIKEILRFKKEGRISFCEIYLGQVYDLLNNREKVTLREMSGVVHLTNSSTKTFSSYAEISVLIDKGLFFRRMGTTGANSQSSRSHAIIILNFENNSSSTINDSNSMILVDLAGSERGIDRKGSSVEVNTEGAEINKSLLALKECIRGIELDKKHLPFRQSKLTQILKNSFVGSSKTCIIATISPLFENVEHTLNTLRYASRIKENIRFEESKSDEQIQDNSGSKFKNSLISLKRKSNDSLNLYKNRCISVLKHIENRIESIDDTRLKLVMEGLEDIYKSIE